MHNVLILDDDPQMLTSLSDVLQSSGYSVSCASSAREAIDRVKAEPNKFELVVADVRMSEMDGLDCVKELRGIQPNLKSVIITGFASEDAPGRAMDLASSDYLRKPFNAEDLLQSVSRALKAGSEATGYQSLLQKVRAAAQKVGATIGGLEGARNRAFEWYFLGIRSGHLGARVARSIWEWLEAAEWERMKAEKDLALMNKLQDLKNEYDKVAHYCKNPADVTAREAGDLERLSSVEFQPFFQSIRDGSISVEQLKLAVHLRSMAPDELQQAPELNEIKSKIWRELKI